MSFIYIYKFININKWRYEFYYEYVRSFLLILFMKTESEHPSIKVILNERSEKLSKRNSIRFQLKRKIVDTIILRLTQQQIKIFFYKKKWSPQPP